VYHVLNRAVGRMDLFRKDGDYRAFLQVMNEAQSVQPMRVLSYALMPNHWHMVLWPEADRDLSRFMFWLTMTHTQRWRHARGLVGLGPLYQGRFKSFPVQRDEHFMTLCRYVERNPLRANLVRRAQDWQWASLWQRTERESAGRPALTAWPVEEPEDWLEWVNRPQRNAEVEALRLSIRRNRPFGDELWQRRTAEELGLESCFRERGRPRKKPVPAPG
jgi:putative transposase